MNTFKKNKRLVIGIIIDGFSVPNYIADLIFWIQSEETLDLNCLIVQNLPSSLDQKKNKLFRWIFFLLNKPFLYAFNLILWKMIYIIENQFLKKTLNKNIFKLVDISNIVVDKIIVKPDISKSGFVYQYPKNNINQIKGREIDILLRTGSGILKGDILNSSKFGVLSFHHGDNRINRGGPACFWEVFYHQEKTGFIIQQLNDILDGGNVLLRGAFPTNKYYLFNLANVYNRSNYYMKTLLKKIQKNNSLPTPELNYPYSSRLFKTPGLKVLVKYIISNLIFQYLKDIFILKFLKRRERWSVSYSNQSWKNLVMWKAKKIPNPPRRFLADPFLFEFKGNKYIFLEDYNFKSEKGIISVYKVNKEKVNYLGEALSEKFHLSFPFIFEHQGVIYMIPETHQANQIRLYECIKFPFKWTLKTILINNISAADTVIFKKDDLWWLLTNTDPSNGNDHSSELSIFYSENLLSTNWKEHEANPIYIDPMIARNGGLIIEDGRVYRVSQKCGFNLYGKSSSIYLINKITKNEYIENLIGDITPSFYSKIKGTHHLDSKGNFSVFDSLTIEGIF